MRVSDRRRFWLAVALAFLAHVTALIALLPLYAAGRAVRALWEEDSEALRVALIFAILLHFVLIVPFIQWVLTLSPSAGDDELLEIDLWSQDDSRLADLEKKKTPEEELEDYQPEEEIPQGQVVESPPSPDKRRPEKSRFLAEQDSTVEKETRSKFRSRDPGQVVAVPGEQREGRDQQTMEGGERAQRQEMHTVPVPEHLRKSEQGQQASEESVEKQTPRSLKDINLQPSMQAMTSALAGSGLDHLEGIVDGDATALNTKGWRYASFFNRVKREVARQWHPDIEYRKHDPYGNIYGFKDRITVLLVILRSDGSLKQAYVMTPSGAVFLDDEAREAVEQAAPFPNVPDGLIDKRDGLVKFTFHFLVEVGEQPIFRIRRYP